MILKSFYIQIIIRVSLILISSIILGTILANLDHGYYYSLLGTITFISFQSWMLVSKINRTNNDLERFLSGIHDQESSLRFPDEGSTSFKKLHSRMNDVFNIIQKGKIESEKSRQILQSVVDHVNTGLLSFDSNGVIEFQNNALQRFIDIEAHGQLASLRTVDKELCDILLTIIPGNDVLYKLKRDNLIRSVLIKATKLKSENKVLTIVSFEDITGELERKELDSWQRLIRVLTHEIMNSISPVTSLTSVIAGYFKNRDGEPLPQDKIDDKVISKTLSGLNTIEETGIGLLDFVEKYRSLTLLPQPKPETFRIENLFGKCKELMESTIPANIVIQTSVNPEGLSLTADQSQVEQVLINLVKNSVEALGNVKKGTIRLNAFSVNGEVQIEVDDNGPGIPDEIKEDIFVPFYTTRENGSGIGLSLSRQIMQNHHGTISVNSIAGNGATFCLRFPDIPGINS